MIQEIKNIYHLGQAVLANIVYGFPGRRITVIGVTGTDGKTTTSSLIYHILRASGKKAAMITTIGAYIDGKVYDVGFHVTTPSPFALQKYLRQAADSGHTHVVLEVTSHALDQNRAWGIPFRVGVLTNITHEHLDYHGTLEKYAQAKLKLLRASGVCVINKDDQSYEMMIFELSGKKIISYATKTTADVTPITFQFETPILGDFNTHNCLAAIAVTEELGIRNDQIRKALKSFSPPTGRQEIIHTKDFMVMIDFAHTPNAFAEILPEVRKITKGRLIHVFGSAAKRDQTKRPIMGKLSARYADIIVLTSEDPRDEPPEKICEEIMKGIPVAFHRVPISGFHNHKNKYLVFVEPDRKKAIAFTIGLAKKGDTVILTGKSHEKSMNYGYGEEPWDEFAVAREALAKHVH